MKKINILLVDRDNEDHLIVQTALDEVSYKTKLKTENDREKIFEVLKECETPDVIFYDIHFPITQDYAIIKKLRAIKRFRHIPLVIYTGWYDPTTLETLYNLGANLYIKKLLEFFSVKKVIEKVLAIISGKEKQLWLRENFLFGIHELEERA